MKERGETIDREKKSVQERCEWVVTNIWEVGKDLKMIKGKYRENGVEKDKDIKEQEKKTWTALKKWIKDRNEEHRLHLKE